MLLSLRRWRPRHLLLAWSGYWLALLLLALGRPALALWRLSQAPPGHGSFSAGFVNSVVQMSAVEDGVTVWSGAASLLTLALWLTGPPLALWLVWLMLRPRSPADDVGIAAGPEHRTMSASAREALPASDGWMPAPPLGQRAAATPVERDRPG